MANGWLASTLNAAFWSGQRIYVGPVSHWSYVTLALFTLSSALQQLFRVRPTSLSVWQCLIPKPCTEHHLNFWHLVVGPIFSARGTYSGTHAGV